MTEEKKVSHKPYERHNARQMALQAIYEWQMAKNDVETMIEQFLESNKKKVNINIHIIFFCLLIPQFSF